MTQYGHQPLQEEGMAAANMGDQGTELDSVHNTYVQVQEDTRIICIRKRHIANTLHRHTNMHTVTQTFPEQVRGRKKAAPQKQQDQEAERDLSAFAAITREMNGAEPNPFSQICLCGSVTQRSTNLGGSQECATLQRALHFKGTKHCQHSRRAIVICCALVGWVLTWLMLCLLLLGLWALGAGSKSGAGNEKNGYSQISHANTMRILQKYAECLFCCPLCRGY